MIRSVITPITLLDADGRFEIYEAHNLQLIINEFKENELGNTVAQYKREC